MVWALAGVLACLGVIEPAAAASDPQPLLVSSMRSRPGESMDQFALRVAPAAIERSMQISGEVCGEFRRDGESFVLDLYSIRRLRHCSYRRLAVHDYTGLTFHTHIVIGETDQRRVQAKLNNPRFSADDYAHPGYLASGRRVLFQSGQGTERRVRSVDQLRSSDRSLADRLEGGAIFESPSL